MKTTDVRPPVSTLLLVIPAGSLIECMPTCFGSHYQRELNINSSHRGCHQRQCHNSTYLGNRRARTTNIGRRLFSAQTEGGESHWHSTLSAEVARSGDDDDCRSNYLTVRI